MNLGYCQAIWGAYGSANNSGHRKRASLAILAAKSVLPIWNSVWHNDNTPYQILTTAGLAALAALNTALYEELDKDNIDFDMTDADIDAYETDSSFWAAAAVC